MTTLAFVDLDGTLVFSARAVRKWDGKEPSGEPYVCVDVIEGRAVAWATRKTVESLRSLPMVVVPTTSRSVEQYLRMTLMAPVSWAIVEAGSTVLRDGTPDACWETEVRLRCSTASAPIGDVRQLLVGLATTPRGEHMLVVKVESSEAANALARDLQVRVDPLGWRAASDGRRVYLMPQAVTKARAAAWVSDRLGGTFRVAAGDSELDRTLLEWADFAMIPAHSPAAGFALHLPRAGVTECGGPRAAEQICDWMTRQSWSSLKGGIHGPTD